MDDLDGIIRAIELDEQGLTRPNMVGRSTVRVLCQTLRRLLRPQGVKVEIKESVLSPSMTSIRITGSSLEIKDVTNIMPIINFADNLEIFPRTDDKMEIVLGFYGMRRPEITN